MKIWEVEKGSLVISLARRGQEQFIGANSNPTIIFHLYVFLWLGYHGEHLNIIVARVLLGAPNTQDEMAKMSFTLIIQIKLQFRLYGARILLLHLPTTFFFLFLFLRPFLFLFLRRFIFLFLWRFLFVFLFLLCFFFLSSFVVVPCNSSSSSTSRAVVIIHLPLQQKMAFFWKNPIWIINPYDSYGLPIRINHTD